MDVEASEIELDLQPVTLRVAGALGGPDPVPLFIHGLPGSGGDWSALLSRSGGVAPDLLGFGRSGKGGHLDFTPAGLAGFLERLMARLELPQVQLVAHGWGTAVAVELARRSPERVERVVICSPPRVTGLAAQLRRPVLGELLMGMSSRRLLARWYRRGAGGAEELPAGHVDTAWTDFDQGTQRAILRLLRSAGVPDLSALRCPLLVLEGARDPWRGPPPAIGAGATVLTLDTGHWPWLAEAGTARILQFLAGG